MSDIDLPTLLLLRTRKEVFPKYSEVLLPFPALHILCVVTPGGHSFEVTLQHTGRALLKRLWEASVVCTLTAGAPWALQDGPFCSMTLEAWCKRAD